MQTARAIADYQNVGNNKSLLVIRAGDRLLLTGKTKNGWAQAILGAEQGWVPVNHIEVDEMPPVTVRTHSRSRSGAPPC